VVHKYVNHIAADSCTTLSEVEEILSTINSEIEDKIIHNGTGDFWKTLLGDAALLRSLGLGTSNTIPSDSPTFSPDLGDEDMTEQMAYIEDILREARHLTSIRKWHVAVIDTVKYYVTRQAGFLQETYASVLASVQAPCQGKGDDVSDEDASSEDSYDEFDTEVYEAGSTAYRRGADEDETVIYHEYATSERSDKSAYDDFSQSSAIYYSASRSATVLSPEPRGGLQGRSIVAGGSLEPLDFPGTAEAEEPDMFDAFSGTGEREWDVANDSELDTGEHHSFDRSPSPAACRNRSNLASAARPPAQVVKPEPQVPREGIVFFRWATKLGRRGKDLMQDTIQAPEVRQ